MGHVTQFRGADDGLVPSGCNVWALSTWVVPSQFDAPDLRVIYATASPGRSVRAGPPVRSSYPWEAVPRFSRARSAPVRRLRKRRPEWECGAAGVGAPMLCLCTTLGQDGLTAPNASGANNRRTRLNSRTASAARDSSRSRTARTNCPTRSRKPTTRGGPRPTAQAQPGRRLTGVVRAHGQHTTFTVASLAVQRVSNQPPAETSGVSSDDMESCAQHLLITLPLCPSSPRPRRPRR